MRETQGFIAPTRAKRAGKTRRALARVTAEPSPRAGRAALAERHDPVRIAQRLAEVYTDAIARRAR